MGVQQFRRQLELHVLFDSGHCLDFQLAEIAKAPDHFLHQLFWSRSAGRDADRPDSLQPFRFKPL